jgi:hypothetical protein
MLANPIPRQCPLGFAAESELLERLYHNLPHRPYCTNQLDLGLVVRSKEDAVEHPYIQLNPPVLRQAVVLDVDRPGAVLAWEDAAPVPNLTVQNPSNGHAHLIYLLESPVSVSHRSRMGPIRYLSAITDALSASVEADPGYTGHIAKTPTHEAWKTVEWASDPYCLNDLAWSLDLDPSEARARRAPVTGELQHGWRNVGLFDALRHWAYRQVEQYRQKSDWSGWCAAVMSRAQAINAERCSPPLPPSEVRATARSVQKWVWQRYQGQVSDEQFSAVQANRGAKGGKASRGGGRPKKYASKAERDRAYRARKKNG